MVAEKIVLKMRLTCGMVTMLKRQAGRTEVQQAPNSGSGEQTSGQLLVWEPRTEETAQVTGGSGIPGQVCAALPPVLMRSLAVPTWLKILRTFICLLGKWAALFYDTEPNGGHFTPPVKPSAAWILPRVPTQCSTESSGLDGGFPEAPGFPPGRLRGRLRGSGRTAKQTGLWASSPL